MRVGRAVGTGADAEERRLAEVGQQLGVERVVAAVVAELDEAKRRLLPNALAECHELASQRRVAGLRIGELHGPCELQPDVADHEAGDQALLIDRRPRARDGIGRVVLPGEQRAVGGRLGVGRVGVEQQIADCRRRIAGAPVIARRSPQHGRADGE